MRDIKDFNKKDLGAILYCHYIDNYMEDDFSFDKGKMRDKVETHYDSLLLTDEEKGNIDKKIKCYMLEGTDYDSYEFKFKEVPNFFLQVTSMFDYDGKCCTKKYKGDSQWCDVGMFFVDYTDCDFDLLKNK